MVAGDILPYCCSEYILRSIIIFDCTFSEIKGHPTSVLDSFQIRESTKPQLQLIRVYFLVKSNPAQNNSLPLNRPQVGDKLYL